MKMSEDNRKHEILSRLGTDLTRMIQYYHMKLEIPIHEILGMMQITSHTVMSEIEREIREDAGEDDDDQLDFPWTD